MAEKSLAKRLKNFFGFDTFRKKSVGTVGQKDKEIVPVTKDKEDRYRKTPFDSEIKRLWDWYLSQTSDSSQTLKDRMDRYDDLEYMVYNDTIISSAVDLYADEISQADHQMNVIEVNARKSAVIKEIDKLLEDWGINQNYVRECGYNLVLYGDSFDVIDFSEENGIEGVIPVDVRDVTERIEFKASEIAKRKKQFSRYDTSNASIKDLITKLDKLEKNSSKNFKSYLLGFKLGQKDYLPPWGVNHYRLYSSKSEFFPYGRSLFINLVGPFRQLKTSKNLMALTRALKFPKEVYEVKVDDGMTAVEQWDAVNQARQEYENNGLLNKNKDEFSVGSEIWIPERLISHKTIENNLRLEDIADIELLRDDIIMGTRIPKGYLVVDRSSFGTSGQSLLHQSKPFGRTVFSVQSAILHNIAHLIRLHFLMTGKFDKEYTEFELSLHFPVIEEASDRLRMKQDTFRLAKDVLDTFKDAIGFDRGESLPPEAIKLVFSQLSFLSDEEVNEIVDILTASKGGEEPEDGEAGFLFEKVSSRMSKEIIYESYFNALKNRSVKEGILNNRHVVTSIDESIPNDYKGVYRAYRENKKILRLEEEND